MTKNKPGETEKKPEEIATEIEQTRAAISQDIDVIGEKLSPEHIKEEAKEALQEAKEAGVEKLRDMKESAVETVEEAAQRAGEQARRAGEATWSFVRENAVPLTFLGFGAGLLAFGLRDSSANGGARIDVKEKALDAQQGVRRLAEGARDLAEENPLALGAAALVAGFGIGMLIPATRAEGRLLGERRQRLTQEVRETVGELGRAVRQTASEVTGNSGEAPIHH